MVEDGLTQLRKSASRIDAFAQFALLEEPLEPLGGFLGRLDDEWVCLA
jgi:hypothetical protein